MAKQQGERGNGFLRAADRAVGIPAIMAVALLRRLTAAASRDVPQAPSVIGLLKASGIGDAVILSGVITDLRAKFPHARLVLFCGESNYAFARLLDDVDEVVPLPIKRPLTALRLVRAHKPDVMIDFGMWPRFEALVATMSGAKWVTGVRTPGQFRHFAYNKVVDHTIEHEIYNYRNLVAGLGVESTRMPRLRIGADRARPFEDPYVVFHLWPGGANSDERSWPTDRWMNVARYLHACGYTIVLSGGPADKEKTDAVVDAWRARSIAAHSIAGLRAEETIVWLRHARGAISVNTGLLHLAAAVGTPVVGLNGPTSGRRWRPLGYHTRCVSSPMVPEGYLNLGWERDDRYRTCMEAITHESVIAAWDDLIAQVDARAGARRFAQPHA